MHCSAHFVAAEWDLHPQPSGEISRTRSSGGRYPLGIIVLMVYESIQRILAIFALA
jgi:hypothetical protein